MKYYIYKYVENNEIIYIGQSINLKNRIAQHKQDKLKDTHAQIYYFECPNKTAMNSWEYFLINKYHPKYNTALKDSDIVLSMDEPSWILYKENSFPTINTTKKKEKEITPRVLDINLDVFSSTPLPEEKEDIIYHFYDTDLFEEKLMVYLLIKSKIKNIPLNEVEGTTSEYIHFCNIDDSGNTYKQVKKVINEGKSLISDINNENKFKLTPEGCEMLTNLQELDIEYLSNIVKYCQHKYTCFIFDALLQSDSYVLIIEELTPYLPKSYTRNYYDFNKRVAAPAFNELKQIGFSLNYIPIKQGNKYIAIDFK